jgi:hypothetical protein
MRYRLEHRKESLATDWRKLAEIDGLVGFKDGVLELYEGYRQRGKMDPRTVAEKLAALHRRLLLAALPVWIHVRRIAVAGTLPTDRRHRKDVTARVPRRGVEAGAGPDRDGASDPVGGNPDAQLQGQLGLLNWDG